MKVLLLAAIGGLLLLAAPAQAQAHYLAKSEARAEAKPEIRALFYRVRDSLDDPPSDWWIEGSGGCDRLSRVKVECDYEFYYDDGMTCYDTVRVIERRDVYSIRYPYSTECE